MYKPLADSTLQRMKKTEIIELLRIAEHNAKVAQEYVDQQAKNLKDWKPVMHGRWILEREPNGKPYCFHCSVCDSDYHCIGILEASDYCPHCGAKMDLGNYEEMQ